jgi:hypothetical protein
MQMMADKRYGQNGKEQLERGQPAIPGGTKGVILDTATIRQLLTAAFDDERLTALCFDHFRPVHESFAAGMSKGQKIQRLMDYCVRQDQVGELLEWVEGHNPGQYARFAPRLERLEPEPPSPSGSLPRESAPAVPDLVNPELYSIWQRHLKDLADHIAQDLALLKEFEDALRYEKDPRRRVEYRREIAQLRMSVAHHKREYEELAAQATGKPPAMMQDMASQLHKLDRRLHPGYIKRIGSHAIDMSFWYRSLPIAAQVAVVFLVLLAIIGLCSTLGRPVIEQWVVDVFPTPTPTAAVVHLTDAHVRFTVTLSSGDEVEILIRDTLTLAPGDRILVGVSVSVNQSPFPSDLTYQYFAPAGSVPEELTGPNVSYAAPEKPGADVIIVRIRDQETGNEIVRSINVEVKEGSP